MALLRLCGRFSLYQQVLLVILGCMNVLIVLSLDWNTPGKPVEETQELRKSLFRDFCDNNDPNVSEGKLSIDQMSDEDLKHFLVDDNHEIIFCYIPGVSSTNWKRVKVVLNQSQPYPDPSSIPEDLDHMPDELVTLTSSSRDQMKIKLKHYTKFMFVQNPLVRLVSVYREKFLKPNRDFQQRFGKKILRLYGRWINPPQTLEDSVNLGIRPSFYNFIRYLLDPLTERKVPLEPHWRQMHRLCHPCHIHYDFVGHQETLREDAEHLLRILNLGDEAKFPLPNVTPPRLSVMEWYETMSVEERRGLYRLYEHDFTLFGYTLPEAFLKDEVNYS